ncbi:hypothetical protein CJD36_020035 [Flavipsychrobacter stenotrophus]|uniref:Uncharacterized protein n=1 Tax=Flavipsychrobacter stenotrophus TaxID=2077091 RepID=A0A2S7SRI9_9BACT|nr:hypothetical protein [Flavipsychrobacter stenotrophus]PQJ09530.1 hypothetical protein CJD36_020035 [Flavipsychrobacter stenotrophus]
MRNAKKVSKTGYWRAQFKADEAAVMQFTGLMPEQLLNLKLDMGREWLVKNLHKAGISQRESESLWMEPKVLRWWNLNWRQYDHWTILPFLHKVTINERYNVYHDMHLNVFREDHPTYLTLLEQLCGVLDLITDGSSFGGAQDDKNGSARLTMTTGGNKGKEVSHAA